MDLGCCCCWADGSMSFCEGWTGKAGKASHSSRYSIFLSGHEAQFDHVKPCIFPSKSGFSRASKNPMATWWSLKSGKGHPQIAMHITTSKVFRDFMTWTRPASSWAEVMAVTLAMLYHGASTRRPLPSALGRTNRAGGVGHHSLQLAARTDLSRLEIEMEMMCHHKLRYRTWDSTFFWSSWVLLASFSAKNAEVSLFRSGGVTKMLVLQNGVSLGPSLRSDGFNQLFNPTFFPTFFFRH